MFLPRKRLPLSLKIVSPLTSWGKNGWKETRAPSIFWTNSTIFLIQFFLAIFFCLPTTMKKKQQPQPQLFILSIAESPHWRTPLRKSLFPMTTRTGQQRSLVIEKISRFLFDILSLFHPLYISYSVLLCYFIYFLEILLSLEVRENNWE